MPTLPFRLVPLFVLLLAQAAACQRPERSAPPQAGTLAAPVRVPPRGSPSALDVASWNVEWFGSRGNGPRDEALQLARVRDVIRGTDADVWGIVEVVDPAAWRQLLAVLPEYDGVLASDADVRGGRAAYHRGEQKVGVLVRRGVATVTSARVILEEHERLFAGRPPLEARLRVTANGVRDELVVIVLHLKAFADSASWRRRQVAGEHLKAYLDATWPGAKVLVVGDWNDDVDRSILPGRPTPFAALVEDPAWIFVTAPLSVQRIASTTGYAELIDHHLASRALAATMAGAPEVYVLDTVVPLYERTTSDHYPVISRYALPGP